MASEPSYLELIDFGDGVERRVRGVDELSSISVNGVSQTISNHAVDLDVANNLITEAQWTQIQSILQ